MRFSSACRPRRRFIELRSCLRPSRGSWCLIVNSVYQSLRPYPGRIVIVSFEVLQSCASSSIQLHEDRDVLLYLLDIIGPGLVTLTLAGGSIYQRDVEDLETISWNWKSLRLKGDLETDFAGLCTAGPPATELQLYFPGSEFEFSGRRFHETVEVKALTLNVYPTGTGNATVDICSKFGCNLQSL